MTALTVPEGYKLVPIVPTEDMVVMGFESAPHVGFCDPDVWDEYEAMSGCQQAAHRAKLCYAAMLEAAPSVAIDAQGWISVDDRLPDDNELVSILFWPYNNRENKQIVGSATCIEGSFYNHEGDEHHWPSHWTRLPAIPTAGAQP